MPRPGLLLGLFAFGLLVIAGCGIPNWWLGAQQGTLFQGMDSVTPLGEASTLTVSLRGGGFFSGQSDYTVFFHCEGQPIGVTKTNADGIAEITHTFDTPGAHAVTAKLDPAELGTPKVPTTTFLAAVYSREQPLILVDIDKTVVAGDFDQVLLSDPLPFPHSQQVLRELNEGPCRVIFLTGRPQAFMRRTREWLNENDYPALPLLVKGQGQASLSPAEFKQVRIGQIKQDFPSLQWALEDRVSDAMAASRFGMRIILLITLSDMTAGELQQLESELSQLPENSQIVFNWEQVRQAEKGSADYSRDKVRPELARLAAEKSRTQQRNLADSAATAPGGKP